MTHDTTCPWNCDECNHSITGPDAISTDHAPWCSLHPSNVSLTCTSCGFPGTAVAPLGSYTWSYDGPEPLGDFPAIVQLHASCADVARDAGMTLTAVAS